MGDKKKAQFQCMHCGTLHWIEDPPNINDNELYVTLKCGHCRQMAKHLWVGEQDEDKYIYYDVTKDSRYY